MRPLYAKLMSASRALCKAMQSNYSVGYGDTNTSQFSKGHQLINQYNSRSVTHIHKVTDE